MNSEEEEEFDLEDYEKHRKLFFNDKIRYYEVINQKTGKKYIAKNWKKSLDDFRRKKIIDLYREVYIISKINHPSILKYIGFSKYNFKSDNKPVIIFEHISYGPLTLILKPRDGIYIETPTKDDNSDSKDIKLNDTQKLILIYGIAAGMSYLHSYDIIHRNLNPSSIFFDDSFLPKISGFNISKELSKSLPLDEPRKDGKFKGEEFYLAPEVLKKLEYGKPSDVYSFALLMYEIVTEEAPNVGENGVESKFESKIPLCYQILIEKCWSPNPNDRPTFDEIVSELKNNSQYITKEVDENEFKNYVNFIENSQISFDEEKVIDEMDDIFELYKSEFKKSKINPKLRGPINSSCDLDISKYKTIGDKFNTYAFEKETKTRFHIEFCKKEINSFLRYEIVNFARSINIMSRLNHPSIIKFVGYSPIDFDNQTKPIFITENFYQI